MSTTLIHTVCLATPTGTRVIHRIGGREGVLIAVYDHFAWVLWDDSGSLKRCWQPDTEKRTELFIKE